MPTRSKGKRPPTGVAGAPTPPAKVRTLSLLKMKRAGERITCVTAYGWPAALALEEAGIDVCLVGDSVGMVELGYDSTLPVTLDEMIHHARAVRRGLKRALMVVDLPFMSYQLGPGQALASAGRVLKESGAEAVKLEGGAEVAATVRALRSAGVAVMGHIGLTPQSVHALGGFRVQGRGKAEARKLLSDARALQAAGAFAVVLEGLPEAVSRSISRALDIPTIGIGAGAACDGQVQVWHDLLGCLPQAPPRHSRAFAGTYRIQVEALKEYQRAVRQGRFPTPRETPLP
jgi:3-methyl-2-oxobutanoate hydroxymethyltransferase